MPELSAVALWRCSAVALWRCDCSLGAVALYCPLGAVALGFARWALWRCGAVECNCQSIEHCSTVDCSLGAVAL